VLGAWPKGDPRPIAPESAVAGDWPLVAVLVLGVVLFLGWLVGRERLMPRRPATSEETLAGYTATLLVLGVLALVVVAVNAYALVFLLPSLHVWLWLPQVRERAAGVRLALVVLGFAGPALLLGSLAFRFGLGLDAPWYLATLLAVDYVTLPALVIALAWFAASAQLAALAVGRYAPYPAAAERPPRGPLRELVRRTVLAIRARRRKELPQPEVLEL
jgi:hypothetical protein